jgi:2-octaprenyl-6-methoxyphenol hydroxylase
VTQENLTHDIVSDVVIAGGGMVGLTLSLALAQGGLRVVVVDALTGTQMTSDRFDGRVSAINFGATRMMRVLGVWPALLPHAQPINDILVSDAQLGKPAAPFSLHFDHHEIGEPLGHLIENRHIRSVLFDAVKADLRIALLEKSVVDSVSADAKGVTATLGDGRTIVARLAVAADGRDSKLREAHGIRVVAWDYAQTGIVATVEHERPHNGVACEHFLPNGPFAILPMLGNRSSLVWVEPTADAARMMALDEAAFTDEVAVRFGAHLGAVRASGPRWSYPLKLHLAREYVRPRFALIGDAAHGIHPLAGQGLNLGFKDVAALTETLLDAARLGRDMGDVEVLRRYERWRRFDNTALAWATDTLNRLFSNDVPPLRFARDLGMGAVDAVRPLSKFFMRHAGGDIGKLPRLMKGEAA